MSYMPSTHTGYPDRPSGYPKASHNSVKLHFANKRYEQVREEGICDGEGTWHDIESNAKNFK